MGATALAIVPAVLGAVGSVAKGISANNQAKFQSKIAKNNAVIADRKAEDSRRRGDAEEAKQGRRTALAIGAQRAAAGGSGVDVNLGSAAAIQEDTAGFGRLDALTIRDNAEREALGFDNQAATSRANAKALRASGKSALFGGILSAAGGLVAAKWSSLAGSPASASAGVSTTGFGAGSPFGSGVGSGVGGAPGI